MAALPAAKQAEFDNKLRPTTLDGFVGQEDAVARLRVRIAAAQQRETALPHILISGPPGLGKTTVARICAASMGSRLIETSGPVLNNVDALIAVLSRAEFGDVVFIDEIHRLNKKVSEVLYGAMEDFKVPLTDEDNGRDESLILPQFTLAGATTHKGHMAKPLRDRFHLAFDFNYYGLDDLVQIVTASAERMDESIERDAAERIAICGRGTPRVANNLLMTVLDYALVEEAEVINGPLAARVLKLEGLDGAGLGELDRRYLGALLGTFRGRSAGLKAIAAYLQEDAETLEDVVEPFLLRQGFILRQPNGRIATEHAFDLYGEA